MIIPYIPEQVFETHSDFKIVSFEDDVLVVDDWYKNFADIKNIILNTPVPRWKWSEKGRNFVDYFDCRLSLPVHFEGKQMEDNLSAYWQLIHRFYGFSSIKLVSGLYEFNYFRNVNRGVDSKMQHFPHVDYKLNCIIYLDDIAAGGTAIYDIKGELYNNEHENLLFDVSSIPKKVIPAKPNRMAIFRGDRYHGGYITDHDKYVDSWRINQVIFFDDN